MLSRNHFARPKPVDGKTPTRGTQTCAVCGQAIVRVGRFMTSDGVRGSWRHVPKGGSRYDEPVWLTVELAPRFGWDVVQPFGSTSWRVRHVSWLPDTWRAEHFLTADAALWFVERELAATLGVTVDELHEHVGKVTR